ncbi:MAG: Trm112 family protein [Reyranellales bacterium]
MSDSRPDPPAEPPSIPKRGGVDPKLLEILVCPATHGPLEYDSSAGELISRKAGLAYPIRDGIPIMLVSEARVLKDVP